MLLLLSLGPLGPSLNPILSEIVEAAETGDTGASTETKKPEKAVDSVDAGKTGENPRDPARSSLFISRVTLRGLKKIEPDAVMVRLKSKAGETFSPEKVREDVLNLFKTGYFYDIQVNRQSTPQGLELIYQMIERPSLVEIQFEGNSEIKSDDLQEASGLKLFELLDISKVKESIDKLQKFYEEKGFYLARVENRVEEVRAGESAKVVFQIQENDKVKIKNIRFLGNEKIKEGYLKSKMFTNEGGMFSFMSSSGSFKKEALEQDILILTRMVYFNEGYIHAKLEKPQVLISPDKKNIFITIKVFEGEQFDVGDVDLAGDILFPREELFELIQLNKQKVFSSEVMQKDILALSAKYGDLGYAFANVIPRFSPREKELRVDVTYEFDKGYKVYIGKINIIGNSKTRDKVIRREMKIREGELYNETRKRQSLENIQRPGIFKEHSVSFKTSTDPETPHIMNIDVAVEERQTGTISLNAGIGSVTGFSLMGQIGETNFRGYGQRLSAGITYTQDQGTFNLGFTDPYFKDTNWSLGFDIYKMNTSRMDYTEDRLGGAISLGHPIGENTTATLRLKNEEIKLGEIKDAKNNLLTDYSIFPLDKGSGRVLSLRGSLEYDERDDRFTPSRGLYGSLSAEYAGLGGSFRYIKAGASAKYFRKLFWELVWRNHLSLASISSLEPGQIPPFNELFQLGGLGSLRGYRFFRVGKTMFSSQVYNTMKSEGYSESYSQQTAQRTLGGTRQALYQMEFEFPLVQEVGLRGVAFYDIGQAEDEILPDNFYSDVGFGFRWFSPMGPLRFEWGFPLRNHPNSPEPFIFEFSVGAAF